MYKTVYWVLNCVCEQSRGSVTVEKTKPYIVDVWINHIVIENDFNWETTPLKMSLPSKPSPPLELYKYGSTVFWMTVPNVNPPVESFSISFYSWLGLLPSLSSSLKPNWVKKEKKKRASLNICTEHQKQACTPANLMKVDNTTEGLLIPKFLLAWTSNSTL